jgi:uncharacterized protein
MHTTPYQRRKLERLLAAEDLSRAELARALAGVPGLEDWLLGAAAGPDFLPSELEAVLSHHGTRRVATLIERFLGETVVVGAA